MGKQNAINKDASTIPVASDTAYDATSWNGNTDTPTKNAVRDKFESLSGINVATDPIFDAKGDLAVGTGANTSAKLAAGANGLFLGTKSGETTGLAWLDTLLQLIIRGDAGSQIAFYDRDSDTSAMRLYSPDEGQLYLYKDISAGNVLEIDTTEIRLLLAFKGMHAPRIGSTATSATPTPNADQHDQYNITALAEAAELKNITGTPLDGWEFTWRIKDNGTNRALTYDTIWRAIGVTLPANTTANKTLYLFSRYNAADAKMDIYDVKVQA